MFISSIPRTAQRVSTPEPQNVEFTGSASGYFRLWIVNLLLTIVTLGIYSAWAKVRRKKYLYQNTWYAGENFDFTGNPVKILKGRILVVALYVLFITLSSLNSIAGNLAMFGLIIMATPWIIIKSRQFNLKNTTYSGIRFNFKADYFEALKVTLLYPVISAFTLMIAKPFELRQRGKFIINNSSFAGNNFNFDSDSSKFGAIVFKTIVAVTAAFLPFIILSLATVFFRNSVDSQKALFFLSMTAVYLTFICASIYFFFACRNEFINNTSYENIRLNSQAKTTTLIWISLTNIIAIILSLGLLTPWATIRKHKYLVKNLSSEGHLSLESLRGQQFSEKTALAEETSDFFDLDFGI